MIDWAQCSVVESIPGKVSGAWVFKGTRVPVSAVLRNLKHLSVEKILEEFPSVTRLQVEALLDFLAKSGDPVFDGERAPAIEIHAHSS